MRALPDDFRAHADELKSRYPHPRSALIMLLHDAQDAGGGFLTTEALEDVAELMNLSPADVSGVATFYTMFKYKPVGRNLISLCTNISCSIWGADETARVLETELGPEGEVTADGACSWERVECLAFCSGAPAAQVNYRDVLGVTPARARSLLAGLRSGKTLDDVLAEWN